MSSEICPLPPEVINLIAAGEVIDSIAAVVRELVENSLDAGATRITVSLWPELWHIQVADNGKGMTLDSLRLCADAHSTSKIRSCEDLWKITSLGFRGEALHSLSQVADLEICSRSISLGDGIGWRVTYKEGKPVFEEAMAIAPGTVVNVFNLFSNVPVRRKALPAISQQLKAIQTIIQHIALTHPQIVWQVEKNDKLWFVISPGKFAGEILPQILKTVQLSDLQWLKLPITTPQESAVLRLAKEDIAANRIPRSELEDRYKQSELELAIGLPDRVRRRRADWIKVAINGRLIRSSALEQAILTAFARTLGRDRYPLAFVHLRTSPTQIDWNRHPAKTEVYLHSMSFWQEQFSSAIEQAMSLNTTSNTIVDRRVHSLLKVAEEKSPYQIDRDLTSQSPFTKSSNLSLVELRAVAQINNTYIVAEHPNGVWLIEQHIAHERVLYEQLQDLWQLLPLETPIVLSNLSESQIEQLQRLGIDIETFGEELWAARTIPAMLQQREDCADALRELSHGGDLQQAQVATACRSAIRNGTPLSLLEMQNLLDLWKNTRNPRTCPHGRPIYLSLEESALARFFRRHWVIGKSHGI